MYNSLEQYRKSQARFISDLKTTLLEISKRQLPSDTKCIALCKKVLIYLLINNYL